MALEHNVVVSSDIANLAGLYLERVFQCATTMFEDFYLSLVLQHVHQHFFPGMIRLAPLSRRNCTGTASLFEMPAFKRLPPDFIRQLTSAP